MVAAAPTPAAVPPRYVPRAVALALAHAAATPTLVLLAGILPTDFSGAMRLLVVVLPTIVGGLVVGWLQAALLRATSARATPWMGYFLAAASPFAVGVVAFLALLVAGVFAFGTLPEDALVWTLFALPFAMMTTPWHFVGATAVLGTLAVVLMRPVARRAGASS